MASTLVVSIDLTKIDKTKIAKDKYLNLAISVNDETNQYGQNVSVYHSQSKEERQNKVGKIYLGNGKCVWNNGTVVNAEWVERVDNSQQNQAREEIDLF